MSRLGEQPSSPKARPYTMRARQESVDRLACGSPRQRCACTNGSGPPPPPCPRSRTRRGSPDSRSIGISPMTRRSSSPAPGHWRDAAPPPGPDPMGIDQRPRRPASHGSVRDVRMVADAAPMMTNIYRDLDTMPAFVGEFLASEEQLGSPPSSKGFRARGRAATRLRTALAHAHAHPNMAVAVRRRRP